MHMDLGSGTITDSTGAAIPGAKVHVHNDGTDADVPLTADDSGYYKAALLQPGTYSVTVTAQGFSSSKTSSITVQLNQVTTVSPHLTIGSPPPTVDASADAPSLNF